MARGGLKVERLYSFTQNVIRSRKYFIFVDIGTNDINCMEPIDMADSVLAFASYLTNMAAIRKVAISQMIF